MKQWVLQILIAFDQLLNALIPGGWADETLSSRAHRMYLKDQPVWGGVANIIDILFFWQRDPGHCERAYRAEARRWQLPPEFRGQPDRLTETYKTAEQTEFWND